MLSELRLENYAVVDNLAVEFAPGLNLLTGETGAGKSIVVDALALLMGEKASPDLVRFGAERAVVQAVFEVESGSEDIVLGVLESNGIDAEQADVILRREISAKGRVFVNNQPATVSVLRQLGPHLASIHAQNQSLASFDGEVCLRLLDSFADVRLDDVRHHFRSWNEVKDRIQELEQSEQDRLRLVDLWTFQKREIDGAKILPREDERLETEKRVLANAEKIRKAATEAFDLLYESSTSASSSLGTAQRHIEELVRYEPMFQETIALLDSARINVEEVGARLRDYAAGVESSPEHLAEVEDRLALLDRLKRKYGPSLEDIARLGEELVRRLSEIEKRDEILGGLRMELATCRARYLESARVISKQRQEAAARLQKVVEAGINQLAMKARFRIEIAGGQQEGEWTSSGFDRVEFMISTNPGDPMHPLEKIASGGELSRVMLVLKASVEARPEKRAGGVQRTLVFDEIDTGIGGRAAEAVGKKLKSLARTNQVLCVTHLPQIAALADHHYLIEKKRVGDRTRTIARRITGSERTGEIARMLSGARLTETSFKHAEQMLKANA